MNEPDITKREELMDDLLDWCKRWRIGRDRNTAMLQNAPRSQEQSLSARIINEAQTMNKELDNLLDEIEKHDAMRG